MTAGRKTATHRAGRVSVSARCRQMSGVLRKPAANSSRLPHPHKGRINVAAHPANAVADSERLGLIIGSPGCEVLPGKPSVVKGVWHGPLLLSKLK